MRASEGLLVGSLLRVRVAADFPARAGFVDRGLDFFVFSFFFDFVLGAEADFFLRLDFFLAMQKV
jgi:hypothetical protein